MENNSHNNSFEILLYSLRFCLQSSNCKNTNGFLYSQLLTPDCEKSLNTNCIPGNNLLDNIFIKNYILLEKQLIMDNKSSNLGSYVCFCGQYFTIAPCGFPYSSIICSNCGKEIGNIKNKKEYYRIFKDVEHKEREFEKYDNIDKNIPNMLIEEYKKLKIIPILEREKFGINKLKKIYFQNNQNLNKLSLVGHRLLNFILYSHLFYFNCLDFISNENISKYLCDGMTCIQMLEMDWNFLKDALQSRGIKIIQIFINLIFDKISEKIKNCKEIKTIEELEKFEEEIEIILEETYKNYEAYAKIYLESNEKTIGLDKNSLKYILLEAYDIKSYNEKEFPFYKYFLKTIYPTKEDFIKEFIIIEQYDKKYPLLANYIREDNPEKFLIKYLPEFNEFSNLMIDYYSNKISRKEASNRIIKEEKLYKKDQYRFKQKLESFIKIWEKLKPFATKYGQREEMPQIDLDENRSIAYYLNDDFDIGKGMYIASAYQNFINWQNDFLDSIIKHSKKSGLLHYFVENMEKTIDVQKATKNEVLNFEIVNVNFMEIIYENSRRNIFLKENTIDYMNDKQFIYDFDSIEKKLGELILPGKVKFNGNEKIKFVNFCYEGFRGNKSNVFIEFVLTYKQVPLNIEKRQNIYDIIKEKFNEEDNELINILFSIKILIYYLIQERKNEKDDIKNIIYDLPDYITISRECFEFFQNPKMNIQLEDLIDFYSFFEFLCFKSIIKNLKVQYKKTIDKNIEEGILNTFEEKKFKLITKKTLTSACRKFISRYLINSMEKFSCENNMELAINLTRYELWPEEYIHKEEIFNKDIYLLKKANLTIEQCYELYNLLKENEMDELKDIKVKKDGLEEDEEKN